jgi:apolipoprotein N-acyltransferase
MFFHWSKKRLPLRSAYVFLISIWLAFEKLHLQWDFSWPWLNLGNVFSENIHWIQWYEYTGTFGGSLWILILNIGILEVIKKNTPWDNGKKFIRELSPWLIAIAIPVIFSIIIFTKYEIKTPNIEVLLVQPNIDPYTEKYGKTNLEFLNLLSSMTQGEINENTDYVFAPETYFASGYGELISEFKSSE